MDISWTSPWPGTTGYCSREHRLLQLIRIHVRPYIQIMQSSLRHHNILTLINVLEYAEFKIILRRYLKVTWLNNLLLESRSSLGPATHKHQAIELNQLIYFILAGDELG